MTRGISHSPRTSRMTSTSLRSKRRAAWVPGRSVPNISARGFAAWMRSRASATGKSRRPKPVAFTRTPSAASSVTRSMPCSDMPRWSMATAGSSGSRSATSGREETSKYTSVVHPARSWTLRARFSRSPTAISWPLNRLKRMPRMPLASSSSTRSAPRSVVPVMTPTKLRPSSRAKPRERASSSSSSSASTSVSSRVCDDPPTTTPPTTRDQRSTSAMRSVSCRYLSTVNGGGANALSGCRSRAPMMWK